MPWTPYTGDRYLSWPEVEATCRALAAAHPDRVELQEIGRTDGGRPLLLLGLGVDRAARPLRARPALWVDGGTHAAEWTGVMSALASATRWVQGMQEDPATRAWFAAHAVYVLPCMSPDGYQALVEGAPFLRSTLRPPREGQLRVGLEPQDIDGDGAVRWMRWPDPAGPFVQDEAQPLFMRSRRLDDDPARAFFVCEEGRFLHGDGERWVQAPLRHGLDLNRNFPAAWAPFQMFGMDGGETPLSVPESAAVTAAVRGLPGVAAALTLHTYTGALLTQPYRDPSPLGDADITLMEVLGREAVRGTGYRCLRVHPDFVYDPRQPIVGVWADTLASVFGIPGYTLELWDPFGAAGVQLPRPAEFFRLPDEQVLRALFVRFAGQGAVPWRPFDHPQLGPVEVGGFDYLRTVRNPPEALLAAECARGHAVAEALRRALPRVELRLERRPLGEGLVELRAVAENPGFLPTSGLPGAEARGLVPALSLTLSCGEGVRCVVGEPTCAIGHLEGWGSARIAASRHPLYPALPARGHRAVVRWVLHGEGPVTVAWEGGRTGRGQVVG